MVGVQQALGSKLRADAAFWWRRGTGAGDQDQFFNTGIVFPISFAEGRFNGWDARLDLAPTHGLRGFVSLGHVHAVYVPPPTGGLFLDGGGHRRGHGRALPDRPRPEAPGPGAAPLGHRHERGVARRQPSLRLGPRDGRRARTSCARIRTTSSPLPTSWCTAAPTFDPNRIEGADDRQLLLRPRPGAARRALCPAGRPAERLRHRRGSTTSSRSSAEPTSFPRAPSPSARGSPSEGRTKSRG